MILTWIGAGVLALVLLSGCTNPTPQVEPSAGPVTSRPEEHDRLRRVMDAAHAAGFRTERQLLDSLSIAVAESSLRPDARNWHPEYGYRPAGDRVGVEGGSEVRSARGRQVHSDRGVWQISSRWWPTYTDAQCDDPVEAARIAFTISDAGRDFSAWDTYRNGAARAHHDRAVDGWPALRPVVRAYLSAPRPR